MFGARLAAVLCLGLAGTLPVSAQQPGEQWEYQGNMEMMGMKMPVQATKVCQQADQKEMKSPPGMDNSNCTVDEFNTEGNTTRFRITCGEPMPMEGTGTATRTDDTLEMNYQMKSAQGEMNFLLSGRKLGACSNPIKPPG